MKTNRIKLSALLFSVMALFSSCSEFNYDSDYLLTKDRIWGDVYVENYVLQSLYAVYGGTNLNVSFTSIMGYEDAITDNAMTNELGATDIALFNSGNYTEANDPDYSAWNGFYTGIYLGNRFLIYTDELLNMEENTDDDIEWLGEETLTDTHRTYVMQYNAEVYVLQAQCYLELLRRYGAVLPILPDDVTSDPFDGTHNNLTAASLEEIMTKIETLCDTGLEYGDGVGLYDDRSSNSTATWFGRVTKETAYAIKSRAFIYGASLAAKAGNTTLKNTYLQKCIDASLELLGDVSSTASRLDTYANLFNGSNTTCTANSNEVIYERRGAVGSLAFAKYHYPIGFELAYGRLNPSHDLVEAYYKSYMGDMDAELDMSGTTPYSAVSSDPRFTATVLYNGITFNSRTLEMYTGGLDASSALVRGTQTGYYVKKYHNVALDLVTGSGAYIPWFIFRAADAYFNLVEAIYYLNGSYDAVDATAGVSAEALLNTIRTKRAYSNTPVFTSNDEFMDFYRNERRVEFAFEGQYYFDAKRWIRFDSSYMPNTQVHGVEITLNSDGEPVYSVVEMEGETRFVRVAEDHPIPASETQNN